MDEAIGYGLDGSVMSPLLARIRRHRETRSISRALALLFVLSGLIGAFAGGAQAADALDGEGFIHCLSVASDDDGDFDGALSCCTLGCPMVSTALAPSPALVPPPRAVEGLVLATALHDHAVLLQKRPSRDGPRGPPILI